MAISIDTNALHALAKRARAATAGLATATSDHKNRALLRMAELLQDHQAELLNANAKDIAYGQDKGLSNAMIDRSKLTPERIAEMAVALREVATLNDPVGEITEESVRDNGLKVAKMRIPLGVILMIYEARPNVTAEAAALCLKSGNAVILRGGSEAFQSNTVIESLWHQALQHAGLPKHAVQLVATTDRAAVGELLQFEDSIDLVIPRGGEGLIRAVVEQSRIPVIKHYKGVCHLYIDADADLDMAVEIAVNSKAQRPSVCNSLETVLVHQNVAQTLLPELIKALHAANVEVRGCTKTLAITPNVLPATEDDWHAEYLDYIVAVKVAADMGDAIDHIETYGSMHTETIVTRNEQQAQAFLQRVHSSCVLVNASTRFNDGAQLGLGAEIGISTSKIHAFGPMGLRELTTQKFIVFGEGHIRS